MQFRTLIDLWGVTAMAADLGLPAKNIRSWHASNSIPADWFNAIERAAKRRGKRDITAKSLADIAEQRRLARASEEGAHAQ